MRPYGVTYQNIFGPSPPHSEIANSAGIYLGIDATCNKAVTIYGLMYFATVAGSGNHLGWIRHIGPGINSDALFFPFPVDSAHKNAWNRAYFRQPIKLSAGDEYRFIVQAPAFPYVATPPNFILPPWTYQDWTINSMIFDSSGINLNPATSVGYIAPLVDVLYAPTP